jgi:hypothetical protein
MERDLHEIARHARTIREAIDNDLLDELEAGEQAALGAYDEETDTEIVPANGDDDALWEQAKKEAARARLALGNLEATLATIQGYRDFAESGAVEATP